MIQDKSKNILVNWEIVSVNPANKNWNWFDLFCYWAVSIQSVISFSLIASLYLIYDLNFYVVTLGGIFASILVFIFSNLIGSISQKYGLPFPVILRTSMGVIGAKYIALFRGIVGLFMFGVQTFFISKAISYLIRILIFSLDKNFLQKNVFLNFFMGLDLIDGLSFLFTIILQYFLFTKGQLFTRKIIKFSALFVYFGLFLFLILIIGENFKPLVSSLKLSLSYENFISKNNLIPLITVTGTLFAYFSILILNFGDFSRYVKNKSELARGNLSLIINFLILSFFSITIVIGSDVILSTKSNELTDLLINPNDIIGKFNNGFLSFIVLIFIFVASSSTNLIANYIPSQNVLINFFPKNMTIKYSGLTISILGFLIGLLWLPILSKFQMLLIIDIIGSIFGPVFGVVIADYFTIKNSEINNKDIFSINKSSLYYYSNGWQLKGLYSVIIGFIFSASTILNNNLQFLEIFSWIIGGIVSFIVYYLLASK